MKLPNSEVGQEVLAAVQTLRNTWTHLLELKLEASKSAEHQCFILWSDDVKCSLCVSRALLERRQLLFRRH